MVKEYVTDLLGTLCIATLLNLLYNSYRVVSIWLALADKPYKLIGGRVVA